MLAQRFVNLKKIFQSRVTAISSRFTFPEKLKGGRIEKWSNQCKDFIRGYGETVEDIVEAFKTKPVKSCIISSGVGVLFAALKTNPDEQSFQETLLFNTSILTMVSDPIRNPAAEEHISYVTRCKNQDLLRRMDLLFLSLVWVADYGKDCDIYSSQCKYLKPKYLTFHERIIDVGLFGSWLNMRRKMVDFDVNPNEWQEFS